VGKLYLVEVRRQIRGWPHHRAVSSNSAPRVYAARCDGRRWIRMLPRDGIGLRSRQHGLFSFVLPNAFRIRSGVPGKSVVQTVREFVLSWTAGPWLEPASAANISRGRQPWPLTSRSVTPSNRDP